MAASSSASRRSGLRVTARALPRVRTTPAKASLNPRRVTARSMLSASAGVVVATAKRRPSRAASRRALSPMPTTGCSHSTRSRSTPGSPKAATMTPFTAVSCGRSASTALPACASSVSFVIKVAPSWAVKPTRSMPMGAAVRAMASMRSVTVRSVLGLISAIVVMRRPARRGGHAMAWPCRCPRPRPGPRSIDGSPR